jgi:hypothetical protein
VVLGQAPPNPEGSSHMRACAGRASKKRAAGRTKSGLT